MEPSAKKRRLAPKVEPQQGHPQFTHDQPQSHPPQPQQHFPPPPPAPAADGLPNPQRNEFESFARHLQDAAMMIYSQTNQSPYANVSVLMMRWEEDTSVDHEMTGLERVLRDRYNYHTERWNIPTCANPSIKLGVQVAAFLENARPDHLLLIYYAGHGYIGPENQLYWSCNPREDAAKIKWNGIRCLFEDAQSDILLLLDTCAIQDAPVDGSHGTKHALAACAHDKNPRESGGRSFTSHITDALVKFSAAGRPFAVNRLFEELTVQKQQEAGQTTRLANGNPKPPTPETMPMPISFPLTPGKPQGIVLAPLRSKGPKPPGADSEAAHNCATTQDEASSLGAAVADLMFDEPRALVCTTFVGDASADMSSFNQWLHNAPANAPQIKVEGMFIGPPTILIISMPQSVWNVVQNEKVCLFLGHISTHNITHLYQRLIGSVPKVEDGKILLEARQAAAAHMNPVDAIASIPHTPRRPGEITGHPESVSRMPPSGFTVADQKDEVEDSAEMQEAAEQLKALSHVRHMSDGSPATVERSMAHLADGMGDVRHDDTNSSHESGGDEAHYNNTEATTPSRPTKRRTLLKQRPSQETRCNLCTHAPFKDSSSLRKHIAAAHTRPFPCAFSFAGCTSTFGSKNEWKRHIASQHLCLQYYRCSSCPQNAVEGKGNEFNRKDLFTQHLRRMHAPFAIKKSLSKGDGKLQSDWENHVKEMQTSCLVTRRKPPQKSACPKQDCQSVFEGPSSWDEWTEHVGRHMEKGEGQRLGVDRLLAKWALEEVIIERKDDGEYRLCNGMSDKDTNIMNSQHYPEAREAEAPLQVMSEVAQGDKMMVDE